MAQGRDAVVGLAAGAHDLQALDARITVCRACPRLVGWREEVAAHPRRSFSAQPYWGRPVTGFGDPSPWLLVLGLAPAAHGGNRTGRVFTGDRSGEWIFAALHRAGLANRAVSEAAGDGMRLDGVRISAPVRCAPPANRPLPAERDACAPWLDAEIGLLGDGLRVVLALGGFAWDAALACARRSGWQVPRPRPRFAHGGRAALARSGGREILLLGCYHVSQQNTFTGRLTERMLDDVLREAQAAAGRGGGGDRPGRR